MKNKIKNFIFDPIKMLAVAGVSFGLALIDSYATHAGSIGDMSLFGKIALIPFIVVLATLFLLFMIIPLFRWLISLFK